MYYSTSVTLLSYHSSTIKHKHAGIKQTCISFSTAAKNSISQFARLDEFFFFSPLTLNHTDCYLSHVPLDHPVLQEGAYFSILTLSLSLVLILLLSKVKIQKF